MKKLKNNEIPDKPGIYIFKDKYQEPIYVGKAKNLRKRVPTYFSTSSSWKVKRLVNEADDISFVISKNEANALLAEYSFIQKYKPKYNVQFKDDKSFPYVTITNDEWPRVMVTRNLNNKQINFGPFPFIGSAKRSLDHLINIFPVRTCSNSIFERHQKLNKPCLLYDIEKCSGPCIEKIDKTTYSEYLDDIKKFYQGNSESFIDEKISEMKTYSKNLEFEKAQKSKQLIQHLENARITQTLMTAKNSNVDVIGVNIGQYDVVLSCLIIRNGRIVGEVKNTFEPLNLDEIDSYMPQIILSLFDKNTPSNEILVSHNISEISSLKTLLEDKWQKEIKVNYPKKGWKKDLLDTALEDAQELRRISDLKRRSDLEFRSLSLEQLKSKLNLKEIPYRIEAYDISNLGDKFRVGSMVVFEDGISKPSMYRRFHIKTFEGQDDFRSMEEIVFRRIKRLKNEKEVDQSFRRKPNLILIDGGKGQLGKAKSVLDHFELDIDVIGLAKKEEEVFLPTSKKSVILNKNSEALFVLQNIRDEAHRFAITENKRLRVRELDLIDVLSIKGVTQSSIENLFNTYKTLNKISKLSINKLSEIVSEQEAEKIYNYFNN